MSPNRPAGPVPHEPVAPDVTTALLLKWMFGFIKPVRHYAAWSCVVLIAAISVEIYALQVTGKTVNHVNHLRTDTDAATMSLRQWLFSADAEALNLRFLLLQLSFLVLTMAVLRYAREVANSKFSMNMVFFLREAVYDKLQRVGFGFHDANSSGQLINRSLSDLQNVRSFIQTALLTTLEIVLVVGGYILLILTKSPWVALLALAPLPLWTIYTLRFSKKVQPAAKAVLEAEDRSIQVVTENAAGVHVIKAFATEKQEIQKYFDSVTEFQKRVLRRVRLFANFQPVIRLIASVSHLSLFFVAGVILIRSRDRAGGYTGLTVGDLMILGGAMGAILGRLQQVATINEQYQNAIVSARRLWEVIDAPPTVPEKPNPVTVTKAGRGEMIFDNVCFGYKPERPVLSDVSFRVPGGAIVAIVGPTGAGKTSLVNLIARFYDPQAGRILLDGVDLRDYSLASLRSRVSLVFQETYLFSDSVSANIAYGRPGIDQGQIESAARLAQAHEFIEKLPQGYDTMLGERGMNLSGGQRQRLAIARAIVTDPRVLVLDDATAAIDAETEDLIRRGMRLTMLGRTTFVIAHRISTVKSADLVVVLEQGRITQLGTHEQLMARNGHYRDIASVQLSGGMADDDQPSHMKRVQQRGEVGAAQRGARHVKDEAMEESA